MFEDSIKSLPLSFVAVSAQLPKGQENFPDEGQRWEHSRGSAALELRVSRSGHQRTSTGVTGGYPQRGLTSFGCQRAVFITEL